MYIWTLPEYWRNYVYDDDIDTNHCWNFWNNSKEFEKKTWLGAWRSVEELKPSRPQNFWDLSEIDL